MFTRALVIILILSGVCSATDYKQWLPNLNMDNPKNWNVQRVPCSNDVIKVLERDTAVYMQSNLTIKELVLPMDGEIILGNSMMLAFSDAPDPSPGCTADGQEVEFIRKDPKSWFDPYNWCITNDTEVLCDNPLYRLDRLDSELVPCQYETAFFPPDHTFFVNVGGTSALSVGRILYNRTTYTSTDDFQSFLNSSTGQGQFLTSVNGSTLESVKLTNKDHCDDLTGCMCGNDHGKVGELICTAMADRCLPANCTDPLIPVGSCCPVCGAMLVLDYGGGFRMEWLKKFLNDDFIIEEVLGLGDVQTIVSKTFRDQIQIVLTDWMEGEHAMTMGKSIRDELNKDIKGGRRLGIVTATLSLSEPEPEPVKPATAAPQIEKPPMASGTIVGVVISILLILTIVAVIVFFFYRRRHGLPFLPFVNPLFKSKETEIELGPSVSYDNGVVEIDTMRGFDNPMYDSPMSKDSEPTFFQDPAKSIPGLKFTNGNSITAFENPVYSQEGLEEDTDL